MIYYIAAVLLTVIDQITKYFAVDRLAGNAPAKVIDGILHFTYVENTGVAFGMFSGMHYVFIPLGIVASALCVWYMHQSIKEGKKLRAFAAGVVVSGAVGNIIDKIFRGFVVDFIDAAFIDFPVFNFADICITVGAVIVALSIIFEKDAG